jgi:serine/threonine protein kinase
LGKKYGEKTDLWSIGILIYFMHFKEFPFDYPSSFDSLSENQIKKIFDRNKKKNSTDNKLDDLINKLLKYNPEKRITWNEYFNHRFFNKENTLKVILLGESGVKKTNIISSFVQHSFAPEDLTSGGSSFWSKSIKFDEFKESIKFDIWDTPGQKKYRSMINLFQKDAKAICLCYDITSRSSFDELKKY